MSCRIFTRHISNACGSRLNSIAPAITPWSVQADKIDYEKLMQQFGCQPMTKELIARLESLTGERASRFIRRGYFYSHRNFEIILDHYEGNRPFYLYTGRGPSSKSMHLGHAIPFMVCQELQRVFDCQVIIQLSDDEKYLVRSNLSLEDCQSHALANARDIMSFGFDPDKTFIFSNTRYFGSLYPTILKIQKLLDYGQVASVFGFEERNNVGQIAFPATQIAPCFSESFPHIFKGDRHVQCLVPYAIDQDPYFRLGRRVASRLGLEKPSAICSQFLPGLQGCHSKMSSSQTGGVIYLDDSTEAIQTKIKKHAYSGGQSTALLHRKYGAVDIDKDVAFQYLHAFMDDDVELERIRKDYQSGRMLSGEVKMICINVLDKLVRAIQGKRSNMTEAMLKGVVNV